MGKLFFIANDKRGVGKSMVSLTLIDYLRDKGPVCSVETDSINNEIARVFTKEENHGKQPLPEGRSFIVSP
jgi:cellulose biosynthesis protein BcsQ